MNGELAGFFKGEKGLRQGDCLSPYLFIMVLEVLSRMLDLRAKKGKFSAHPLCISPCLTHLAFADDLLVFSDGSHHSLSGVCDILQLFHSFIGLDMNPVKSELFFGGFNEILGVAPKLHQPVSAYSSVVHSKDNEPVAFLDRQKNATSSARGARVAWLDLCKTKHEGGLGICSLEEFTTLFRLKQVWHPFTRSGSLWVRWLDFNVFGHRNYWLMESSPRLSSNIRKMIELKPTFKRLVHFKVSWDQGSFVSPKGLRFGRLLAMNTGSCLMQGLTK
ncbi:PREDICTED: uncharacterized protein LOC104709726 [Camelina sativa]|uniref:Uncharacterized protein LOC104709726 n=1 Tax=Camelina sativa TaxID=90675 RepID=A0ABM0TD79_CAMSA|nr:PREDICTED: uncharacterized protein LOC104709726 [Camelina sativa]